MANKQQLQSAGDGTAIPVGYVGETQTLAFNAISAITANYVASNGLTLTAGTHLISGNFTLTGGVSTTGASVMISTNNASDNTGSIGDTTTVADPAFGGNWSMITFTYTTSSTVTLYAKALSYGASRSATVKIKAVRLA